MKGGIRGWLVAAILAVIAISLVALRHVPTPNADLQVYASIARAEQLFGVGVPTETMNSPVAVDHVTFYGPVFFKLSGTMLRWFGVTLVSFRIASLLGMAIFAAAAAVLAHELSGARDRWLWVLLLLVLTPEGNLEMGTGVMHMLAVGFQMLGLALFVRGLRHPPRQSLVHGTMAGAALAMAAMTTPRSYLFIAAFFATGLLLPLAGFPFRGALRRQCVAAAIGFCVPFLLWIRVSHGDPIKWTRYMAYIFSHEDTDVAILPTATREWLFSWTPGLTPLLALVGAAIAARGVRLAQRRDVARTPAAAFALLATFITYVITVAVLNYTFTIGEYFALPLFAVVIAMPSQMFGVTDRTLAILVAAALFCEGGLFAIRVARTAARWEASNPTPLNEFVRVHVPRGSVVVGPEFPYFFPVERSGSRFRTVSARSWADWARWVPIVEPDAVQHAAGLEQNPPGDRFFIWPSYAPPPDEYGCVQGHAIGSFEPARTHLDALGRLGRTLDLGYPATTLYRLPSGCPSGYDPTIAH